MSYQVTARKWRPQTFDDIVEQQHVTRTLKNAIRLERVAHAYLFAGTRGVGKTTTARVLAKALNCERGPTPEPCNVCSSCLEVMRGASLDMLEIDGASNRGIDEIRDLRERLRYLPSRSRYKVIIIDEVHMLTKEAFNALLKTLEEPPPHVVFIFATTELEKIPYTIVSRCQRFEFKRVSLAGIVAQLERVVQSDGITISRTSLMRIAKTAEGSLRDAESLLDQVVAYCGLQVQDAEVHQLLGTMTIERLAQCLTALFRQDAATALCLVDALQAEGHEAAGILRALLEGLRHLIILKTAASPHELIPISETDLTVLRPVAKLVTVEDIYGHFHVLSAAENSLRYASNPFLVLEMALVRVASIGPVQSLQTILEQLQRLQAGLPVTLPSSSPPLVPAESAGGSPLQPLQEPALAAVMSEDVPQKSHHMRVAAEREQAPVAAVPDVTPSAPPVTVKDFWEVLQEHMHEKRPSIASFLQAGRVQKQTEQELIIDFAKQDRFAYERLLESENMALVHEAVRAVLGRPLQVKLVMSDEAVSSSNGVNNPQSGAGHAPLAQEEMQRQKRETIQAVLDIFDGRLIM
jgi:DNA polymerase III subunit gamma/tau